MKEEQLLVWNNWHKKALCSKSIMFFLHAFLCKQRLRQHHEWCSSLWLKFLTKGPIFLTFFQNNKRNIPPRAQCCFKKSWLALKNRTFQVKPKTTKIFNKTGHYDSFFFRSRIWRHNEGERKKPLLINRMSS